VDKMKQWVVLTVVGVLVVGVLGWMFLISPKRSTAADLRTQAAGVETSNRELETKLATLKAQSKQLPRYQKQLAQVAAKIPDNPALPGLIRALTDAAEKANVELVTVAPSAPVAYAPAAAGAAPAAAGAAPAASGTQRTPSATGAASAAGGLQVITLSLKVYGDYFSTENFFDQLEQLARAFKVTGMTIAPGTNPLNTTGGAGGAVGGPAQPDGRNLLTNIDASVFMSPPTAPAATAPVAPAPVK
jgi:Tfp pilus assembly protein PilO